MRQNFNIKMFEQWVKQNYGNEIINSPVNSMTPFVGELPEGKKEYIFIVKAESWLYEPLKGKTLDDTVPMGSKAYMEGDKLIWGFDIDPDINLESEIPADKIKKFLNLMIQQDKITVVIVDHLTMNIVWMTNNYPFKEVKDQFKPLFEQYGLRSD